MITNYVEFEFSLANGLSKTIRINDIKQDPSDAELTALADLFIEKSSQWKGSAFTKLIKCSKFSLEETQIV